MPQEDAAEHSLKGPEDDLHLSADNLAAADSGNPLPLAAGSPPRWSAPPAVSDTDVTTGGDDDVVEDGDPAQLTDLAEAGGDVQVLP